MTAGAAPTIEATPASGTTIVPKQDIESRQPSNLTQSVENVAGVSSVSEGQAAVPTIRGLARGRSLVLLDGARVSSERRVGSSATYVDPVRPRRRRGGARPGLGRLRLGRVRRRDRGPDARGRARGAAPRRGHRRLRRRSSRRQRRRLGLVAAGLGGRPPRRRALSLLRELGQPGRRGRQLGLPRQRRAGARLLPAGARHADGGLAGRLRPRHRPAAEQLGRRALLLSRGELEPVHAVVRQPAVRRVLARRVRRD